MDFHWRKVRFEKSAIGLDGELAEISYRIRAIGRVDRAGFFFFDISERSNFISLFELDLFFFSLSPGDPALDRFPAGCEREIFSGR